MNRWPTSVTSRDVTCKDSNIILYIFDKIAEDPRPVVIETMHQLTGYGPYFDVAVTIWLLSEIVEETMEEAWNTDAPQYENYLIPLFRFYKVTSLLPDDHPILIMIDFDMYDVFNTLIYIGNDVGDIEDVVSIFKRLEMIKDKEMKKYISHKVYHLIALARSICNLAPIIEA
jgi:hypothetical protein